MITTTPRMTKKAIKTMRLAGSLHRAERIIAKDGDGNRLTYSVNLLEEVLIASGTPHGAIRVEDLHKAAALALCQKMKWKGNLVSGWLAPAQYVHVFTK